MTKVMRYENGKAITGQVDSPFKVDWSEWQTMTDAQKKGKKWLIENVPGAEGEIDAELLVPLWTNPSPTAAFAPQSITLASDDYDFLLCIAWSANSGSTNIDMSTIVNKGDHILFSSNDRYRTATYTNDTTYFFNNGYINGGTTHNEYCVPQIIYGFKKSVKIKFDALAKDVSTLASKCMLEDGETSVEDKLNDLAWKDITSQCTWASASYFETSGNVKCVKVNTSAHLMHIAFNLKPGVPNMTAIVTIPNTYPLESQSLIRHIDGTAKLALAITSGNILRLARSANSQSEDYCVLNIIIPY